MKIANLYSLSLNPSILYKIVYSFNMVAVIMMSLRALPYLTFYGGFYLKDTVVKPFYLSSIKSQVKQLLKYFSPPPRAKAKFNSEIKYCRPKSLNRCKSIKTYTFVVYGRKKYPY